MNFNHTSSNQQMKRNEVFFDFIEYHLMKGNPGAIVKLLPCDHEVMVSSLENSLL
jgi:hypothetical protein